MVASSLTKAKPQNTIQTSTQLKQVALTSRSKIQMVAETKAQQIIKER